MGVKSTCRSPNRGGGCPFLYALSAYSKGASVLPSPSTALNFQTIGANFRQKGAKVNDFLGVLGVLSGKSETKKGKI